MASGTVFLCGKKVKKVVSGSLIVEKENVFFRVTIADEVFPVTDNIRDAVRVLENRSLASKIAKAFERDFVSDKSARRLFPGFGIRYFPTEFCYLSVVKISSPQVDSESTNLEA